MPKQNDYGDENIVLTDLVVQWKITEPNKFYLIRRIRKNIT